MTEIDTSREAVTRLAAHADYSYGEVESAKSAYLLALLARAEKAEAERDGALGKIEQLEGEADPQALTIAHMHGYRAGWGEAIEAAIDRIDGNWSWDDPDFMQEVYDDLRRAIRKGEPT